MACFHSSQCSLLRGGWRILTEDFAFLSISLGLANLKFPHRHQPIDVSNVVTMSHAAQAGTECTDLLITIERSDKIAVSSHIKTARLTFAVQMYLFIYVGGGAGPPLLHRKKPSEKSLRHI